ncbi:MAG: hypothetical protein Q7R32_05270, partial [Dehalococcoidia bacterium]|nr:hypothetical protein [Dehalococcoidia bacterium]
MRILIRALPLALAAALLMLFALACKSGGGGDTSREITDEELTQMVLALTDYGGAYGGFQTDDENGFLTLEQRADEDFDPQTETQDLQQFDWTKTYAEDFVSSQAVEDRAGVYVIGSDVDLYTSADGAAEHFADSKAELSELAGKTSEGFTVDRVETFQSDVGDEAVGFNIDGTAEDEDGSKFAISAGGLAFRHGRLMGSLGFATFGDGSFEEELKRLAATMDQRISRVLAGAAASDEPADDYGDLVSADPLDVLAASGERFEQDVDSLQAELVLSMNIGGFAVDVSSEMAFQAPDQMHATMDLTGLGTFEILLLGAELYMNMPGQGWVLISLDDAGLSEFGLDPSTFENLMTDHSMVDYQKLIESIGGDVQDMGPETVDGSTFQHYRAAMDFGDLVGAFSDAFGATSDLGLESVSGPLTLDVWVDPDTTLP